MSTQSLRGSAEENGRILKPRSKNPVAFYPQRAKVVVASVAKVEVNGQKFFQMGKRKSKILWKDPTFFFLIMKCGKTF